ncbi:recombinase family protein [Marinobacter sp. V034]|uniref:recombinase family protein n=1 Tax=Marinobacter sp. V034 TaxID=3459610 RepID=UPI0040450996
MIIGYTRASSQDHNAEFQIDALQHAGCEKIFREELTGHFKERPVLQQCLRTLKKGDVLVIWKLGRMARSLKDLVETIQDLKDRNIGFKSLSEGIDTTGSEGQLVFHVFGALAEFEHDLIRERTKEGLQATRARGRKGGRKPSMSEADVKEAVAMLTDPNITKKEVAEHFRVTRTTLNSSLARLNKERM